MEIKKDAVAGTLESSDIMIHVEPGQGTVEIELDSSVDYYYGDAIRETMYAVAEKMGVTSALIHAVDHGALDCTIRARLITALRRAGVAE